MRVVEGVFSDVLGQMSNFIMHSILPWAWDNKFWIMALIPVIALIAIAKWMWD
jgi:hypothetical protein